MYLCNIVLDLGDISTEGSLHVIIWKSILLKEFISVHSLKFFLNNINLDEIIKIVKYLAPTFELINLEDISSPYSIEIEERIKVVLDILAIQDEQSYYHLFLYSYYHSLKIVNKKLKRFKICHWRSWSRLPFNIRFLHSFGPKNIIFFSYPNSWKYVWRYIKKKYLNCCC